MFDNIKQMKAAQKLKFCFTLVVMIASFSGVLGLIFLFVNNLQYSEALVSNGFSQGEIGTFSTYLNKEPSSIREIILFEEEADSQKAHHCCGRPHRI